MRARPLTLIGLALALLCSALIASAGAQAPAATCPPASTSAPAAPAPEPIVACVGSTPITTQTFRHWSAVARKATGAPGKHRGPSHKEVVTEVMSFLISSEWVIGEAQNLGIVISEATVRHTFEKIRHEQFPKHKEFRKFLEHSGQTVADLLFRVRLNLLSQRIAKKVAPGGQHALGRFAREFKARWAPQTYCAPAYAVSDCGHVQSGL